MAHDADSHDTQGDHHAAATVADGPGSPGEWLLPLVIAVALTAITLWALLAPRAELAPPPVAARPPVAAPGALGAMVEQALADGTRISVPERGVEGRLLAFIRDPAQQPDKTTWFDFDRLTFETGSATLGEGSRDQLVSVAAILAAFPAVKLKIGGYTDNVGDAALNQQLSAQRAASVQAMLVHLGVAQDRLAAEGYGDQFPVGDNATPEGRAMNRRISMRVVEK
jgi:K(+)-stimulated pyrophosphate-energized sodium pump